MDFTLTPGKTTAILIIACLLLSTQTQLQSCFAVSNHPRMFFDISGLDALKAKSTDSLAKQSFDAIVSYAKSSVSRPPPKPSDYPGWSSSLNAIQPLVGGIESMAFLWLITKDESYASGAKKYLLSLQQWSSWYSSPQEDDALCMGFISRGLAVTYDWMYDYLQPEERATIRSMIQQSAGWIYSESFKGRWWTQAYACNWLAVPYCGLGLAGLAFAEELPESAEWINLAKTKITRYLDSGCPDGGWGEGLGYWQVGTFPILLFADALKNAGDQNLYQHPWLRMTWRFPLYCLFPSKQGLVNFGDSNYDASMTQTLGTLMTKFAAEYRNGFAQWYVYATGTLKKQGVSSTPWNFVWFDSSVSSADPNTLSQSTLFRGIGWAIMRTGWTTDDVLLALKSGPMWNHGHADHNSLMLEYCGERLATDPGYGPQSSDYFTQTKNPYIASIGHNTILVNNVGQTITRPTQKPDAGGTITSFTGSLGFDSAMGDASATYPFPMKSFIRQISLVKPSYFVIHDRISAYVPSSFSWLLHTSGRIELGNDTVLIRGNKVSLLLNVMSPLKMSYTVLRDQKQMIGWARETPIEYVRIENVDKSYNLDLLVVVMLTVQAEPLQVRNIGSGEEPTSGITITRGGITDTHLYSSTGGSHVNSGKIQLEGQSCFISATADNVRQFALQGGTALQFNGRSLVSSSKPVSMSLRLVNDTADGAFEAKEDCSLEFIAPNPALVLVDGKQIDSYAYSPDKRTLALWLTKGAHTISLWGPASYQETLQALRVARESYESVRKNEFSTQAAKTLLEQSNATIQQATQALENHDLALAQQLAQKATRQLAEAATVEQQYQTMKILQLISVCSVVAVALAGVLLYLRRRKTRS